MLGLHRIAAYAVSYDSVELLTQFAAAYHVTYPLLSDGDSRVIRRLGLLNALIPPDHPWHGVPYPGTLLLDGDGRVTATSFYAAHGIRDSIARLLEEGFGVAPEAPGMTRAVRAVRTAALVATATLSAGTIRPGQVHTFVLILAPNPGQEAAATALLGESEAVDLVLQPVDGVVFGPVEAAREESGLVLRVTVTAARRREDFVLSASVYLHAERERPAPAISLCLPVRYLPNVAPAV